MGRHHVRIIIVTFQIPVECMMEEKERRQDISHIDQLTFTVRYIHGCEPVERFLKFIPIFSHGAKNLADTVVDFLKENNIPLSNCHDQSYDNASNMSERYTGLQARIREPNEFAIYVPCAGHSLNLVGVKVAECGPQIVSFFEFVQRLYSFLSASTHRWNVLKSSLGKDHVVVKCLSDTRWSAHFDGVTALHGGFEKIQDALDALSADTDQEEIRDKFNEYELKGKSTHRCLGSDYSDANKRERKLSVETFLPILDSLNSDLTKRAEAYQWIGNLFSFFGQLKTIDSEELNKKCEKLANMYHKDLDCGELLNECK
ncbi:zinc finger MYM-type protein 1-like [Homarus americanus]|uniref:zinc finger MYM-type protein 1-like n=1 Tax=Homarus americanus TaxID=6706 RepID=UPI001C492C1A|nr:zinc finger MYM-type protein 1-like [Homarus americanus]